MANNPFDPLIVQVKKTLDRGGISTVNRGYGSLKSAQGRTRPAPPSDATGLDAVNDMTDVDVNDLADGQVLVWDAFTGKWVSGGISLDALTDVDTDTVPPTFGQALVWDGTQWEPGTVGGGGGGGSVDDRRWAAGPGEISIDEFNDYAINPAWVMAATAAIPALPSLARPRYVEAAHVLSVKYGPETGFGAGTADGATARHHGLIHPLSDGPMAVGDAIYTAFNPLVRGNSSSRMCGLVLSTTGDNNGNQLYFRWWTGGTIGMRQMSAWTGDNNIGTDYAHGIQGTPLYTRIVRTGAMTWRGDVSPDGISWILGQTLSTWGYDPVYVGFAESNWNTVTPSVVSYEFIRRVNVPRTTLPATLTRTWASDGTNGIIDAVGSLSGTYVTPVDKFVTSMSSQYQTLGAALGIDHDPTTQAHTDQNVVNPWWKIDFGSTRRLTPTRFGFKHPNDSFHLPRQFVLEGSNDDATWTTLYTAAGVGPTQNAWWSAAVAGAGAYRHLRVRLTAQTLSGQWYFTFQEIEFWGTLAP